MSLNSFIQWETGMKGVDLLPLLLYIECPTRRWHRVCIFRLPTMRVSWPKFLEIPLKERVNEEGGHNRVQLRSQTTWTRGSLNFFNVE